MEDVQAEHRAVIRWLNDQMPEVDFFLVSIEVWQIGDSAYGPKFNILEQPNDWIKTAQKGRFKLQLNETQRLDF